MSNRWVGVALAWVSLLAAPVATATDAGRGAQLYLQLPGDVPTCVSCHGADPSANRNNILRAADQPSALLKALGTVSAMGFLRPVLSDTDIDDLTAYLGVVARQSSSPAFTVWPRTFDFGTLQPGAASPPALVRWRNLTLQTVDPPAFELLGRRFEVEHDCRSPIAPGADCRISLRALAAATGDLSDVLRFDVPAAALVGLAARVRAEPGPVWVHDAPAGLVDFGPVVVGDRATRQVTLRNAGTAPGAVGRATLTGPGTSAFEWTDECTLVLLPGQACTMSLHFRPGTAAAASATLQWRGDGSHAQTLELNGQGLAAPVVSPPTAPLVNGPGGGGGCAATPIARPGDLTLPALLLAALAGLRNRRRRTDR